jgi:2-polyprenyl-3-methyl-5-hydroxy-6-metoxy-1,4-benzoquinol methylase
MNAYADRASAEARWRELMAPTTGDVETELLAEAAEFFGIPISEARARAEHATTKFTEEWIAKGIDPGDRRQVIEFYNNSETEVFDLIGWHASDPIHHRTLHCLNIARAAGARSLLDYGSGIGSDAIVFAQAGLDVTLADVSDPLRRFAQWRCERRGFRVRSLDLKRESPSEAAYDAAICFDVLEHVPDPVAVVKTLTRALTASGYLFLHAPFGSDPLRPMHINHEDVVTPRMRSLGFRPDAYAFPSYIWPPYVWRKHQMPWADRAAYYIADVLLPPKISQLLTAGYKRLRSRAPARRMA